MNLRQVRIDDRLIHGQVVVGCCEPLGVRRLILCDDDVAGDDLHRQIYESAVPPGIEVHILDRASTASMLDSVADETASLLVTSGPADVLWLVEHGADFSTVVVGGLHHSTQRTWEAWPGVFVSAADREDLRALIAHGVEVVVQAVPAAPAVSAAAVLKDPA